MAKVGMIERNNKRERLEKKYADRRAKLKAIAMDRNASIEERFTAQLKMAELPRNSAKVRYRNRCEVTGRPRGYYRKFDLCRNQLRELGSFGVIPGLVKSSW